MDEVRRFGRFAKGGVVHDDQVLAGEARAEPGFEPGIEHFRIGRAFEQGSAKSCPIRAAISEVRGLGCPDVRPYTRCPLGAYP